MYEPTSHSDQFLEESINRSGRNLIFLSTEWCGDCRAIKPFVQDIKTEVVKTANWFDADRDDNIEVAKRYNLKGLPSFILFENGQEIDRIGHGERLNPKQVLDWYQATLA